MTGLTVPLTGSQLKSRERLDTASGHCMFAQQWCSDASSTQSYLFPLSAGYTSYEATLENTRMQLETKKERAY